MTLRTIYLRRFALGLLMLTVWVCGACLPLYECFRTLSYQSTIGRVISSRLEDRTVGNMRRLKPIIEYSYVIGANEYTNDRIAFVTPFDLKEPAELIVKRYRPKDTCTIYFDPANPRNSVLSKELPTLLVLFGISSFVLIAVYFGLTTFSFLRSNDSRVQSCA